MKRVALLVAAIAFAPAVHAQCSFSSGPTNINFGMYSVFSGSPVTATSTFQVQCTFNTATVTLSRGGAPTYNPRLMTRTVTPLMTMDYNLFMDAANTTIWGDGTSGTSYLQQFVWFFSRLNGTIYATIPAGLDIGPGTYTDTVQATVDWGNNIAQRSFTITAAVPAECTVSTSALNFGGYDPVVANSATPKDGTATVDVYCTKGALASVALDTGSHASGSTRRMLGSSGDFLNYELYRDASRTTVWNSTNIDTGTSASRLTPINGGFTVYGRIPAGQDVSVGNYSDTVLVTVSY
ncbi:MAG TPA: spore coat U domain-containing protein [Thermoanaerobaculia bacterium]|nr:spore coat U domain-containing protein [Thermoanaerobaculia bacterium]